MKSILLASLKPWFLICQMYKTELGNYTLSSILKSRSINWANFRPILLPTIECCALLRKLYKAFFDAKHLEKGLNRKEGGIFGAFFFQKSALSGQYRTLP